MEEDYFNQHEEERYQKFKARFIAEIGNKKYSKCSAAKAAYSVDFNLFWLAWPQSDRKESKAECYKVWVTKNLIANTKEIIAHVAYCKANKWKDPQFIPAPIVYLRSARWDGAELVTDQKVNGKPWYLSSSGIVDKGFELGINKERDEPFPFYRDRIYKVAGVTPDMLRGSE